MGFAVRSLDMPIGKAALRRVAWVNLFKFDTMHLCFVGEELLQLCERPILVLCSIILASNRRPRTDVGQVFNPYRTIRVFGLENQTLRNNVVDISLKAGLPARHLFQVVFSRLAAALLQRLTQLGVAFAGVLDSFAAEHITVTGYSDIGHTHVDTQRFVGLALVRVRNIAHRQQKELFGCLAIDQITLALLILQEFLLAFACAVGDVQAPIYRPDADRALVGVPVQDTTVVGDCPMRFETALAFLVQFVGIRHLCEHTNNHLGSNTRFVTQCVIQRFMQLESPKHLFSPRELADAVAQSIGRLKRLQKSLRLFGRGIQSDLGNQFHAQSIAQIILNFKYGKDKALTSPHVNVGDPAPIFDELIALELEFRYSGVWRRDHTADEKDLVYISNDAFSIEIKTSSSRNNIYGNRSYAQVATKSKKNKSGYYLAINFEKFVQKTTLKPQISSVRFGWLDHVDWIGQTSATGQQARLSPAVEKNKLITLPISK